MLAGCTSEDVQGISRGRQALGATEGDEGQETEIVYELVRVLDREGNELSRSEDGALDRYIWRKAARPEPLLDGEYVYQVESQIAEQEDGTILNVLTYRRRPNDAEAVAVDAPPKVDEADVFEPREDGRVHVGLEIAGYPDWDVPLMLPPGVFSEEEEALGAAERDAGYESRRTTFEMLSAPLSDFVGALGGELVSGSWSSGVIGALVEPNALGPLIDSALVAKVWPEDAPSGLLAWHLNEGGYSTRYNTAQMVLDGYNGNDTTIGILEPGLFNDEACFQYDGANCTGASRFLSRFQCDDPFPFTPGICDSTSNLDDDSSGVTERGHATVVVATAAADYTDDQGDGQLLGDSTTSHSLTWEQRATSLAPEVNFRFGGGWSGASSAATAIDKMAQTDVIAINMSWYNGGGVCHPAASGSVDLAVENAFDDGKLMVIAAGNNPTSDPSDPFGACDVRSHAALPKALSVNGLSGANPNHILGGSDCSADYHTGCRVAVAASAYGGADATTPDNVVRSRALSLNSLAAAQGATYLTDVACSGGGPDLGHVYASYSGAVCGGGNVGSSFAAPVVTNASAVVHEWAVDWFGPTAANGVGRLQALMLGMADSHEQTSASGATTQRSTGTSGLFGMGRLKLKKPTRALLTTVSLTDTANQYSAFVSAPTAAVPLPAGTEFFKCVALQHEDMSSKSKISDVLLNVKLKYPVGGGVRYRCFGLLEHLR